MSHGGRGPAPDKTLASGLTILREKYRHLLEARRRGAEELARTYPWLHVHQAARYIELFGERGARRFLTVTDSQVAKSIRVNTLKTTLSTLRRRLERRGFRLRDHPYLSYGLIVEEAPYSPGASLEYLVGYYTIQGPASMMAVPAMEPVDGDVVDLCAGAGVKTTQIAQHSPDARITAFDISRRKLAALKNNASRLGVDNIIAYNMDATNSVELLGRMSQDNVLLDAPCSGEGLLPFQKGRWPRSFEDIISRMLVQYRLAVTAARLLRKGGTLVYSTCTVSVEENEYLLSLVLRAEAGLEPEKPPIRGGSEGITDYLDLPIDERLRGACRRFFPHIHGTEGFTICRLRRR